MEIHSNNLTDSDIEIAVLVEPSIADRFLPHMPYPLGAGRWLNIGWLVSGIVTIVMMFLLIFILVGICNSNDLLKEQSRILEEHNKVMERQNNLLYNILK